MLTTLLPTSWKIRIGFPISPFVLVNCRYFDLRAQTRETRQFTRTRRPPERPESPSVDVMDNTLDQTTLATIALLESRLLRIEHILYGPTVLPTEPPAQSAISSLAELEHRFNQIVKHLRVYAEILKICKRPFSSSPFKPL